MQKRTYKHLKESGRRSKIFPISAVTKQGVRDLLFEVANLLETTPEFPMYDVVEESEASVMYKFDAESLKFEITRESDAHLLFLVTISRHSK